MSPATSFVDPPACRAASVVDSGATRRVFLGEAVTVRRSGAVAPPERRLPGALAALHGDRVAPRLAARVHVSGGDGIDRVEVEFQAHATAQIIAADPMRRGYGFINETVGEFSATVSIGGQASEAHGLAVMEHVD